MRYVLRETLYQDPISGEKVVGDQYRSKLDEVSNLAYLARTAFCLELFYYD